MSGKRLLVINPNSNAAVTQAIDAAVDPYRRADALDIVCITLDEGPFGIETDDDILAVAPLVVREVSSRNGDYDAFIVACYSDPGLEECRANSEKPVFGIQESAVTLCATDERRFGVLALSRESIERHVAYIRSLGLQDYYAGERPLDVGVAEAASEPGTLDTIVAAGRELIDEDGAETLILGCAGLAAHRRAAQERLSVPVIDPVQAAVTMVSRSVCE